MQRKRDTGIMRSSQSQARPLRLDFGKTLAQRNALVRNTGEILTQGWQVGNRNLLLQINLYDLHLGGSGDQGIGDSPSG
jgi:hypothetical protein